jgi:methionyl aminopeptidase
VRPGATTAEIDAAVEEVFQRYDAVPLFKGVPGKIPFPNVTCISVNEEVVHGIPGPRRLREGDIVSIDTGCRIDGWCGDAARTHAVGRVAPRLRELLDVTREAFELAVALMPESEMWSQVAEPMAARVRKAGMSVVEQLVGHGIGRELHEPPQVPNYCNAETRKKDFRLRPGLVLAIEPMVNLGGKKVVCRSDHWTQATADGKPSAHYENTVALTADGCRLLTGPPENDEERDWLRG